MSTPSAAISSSPGNAASWRLSRSESLDLLEQIASVAGEETPLAATLRVSARETTNRRLADVYSAMAVECDQGRGLADALDAAGVRISPHLRAMLGAGTDIAQLNSLVDEVLEWERRAEDLRRRTWPAMFYPLLLIAALGVWWFLVVEYIVRGIQKIFLEFGSELPHLTQQLLTAIDSTPTFTAGLVAMIAIVAGAIYCVGGKPLLTSLMYELPFIGPLWRYAHLAEFSNLLAILLKRAIPLPQALEIAGASVRSAALRAGAQMAAAKVSAGESLATSLASTGPFPPTLIMLSDWGQRQSLLTDAFRAAAEYFEQRQTYQSHLLVAALPPLVLVAAAAVVQFVVIGVFSPMIKLISDLS